MSGPATNTTKTPDGRIIELDALRGLSVAGIVLMNVFAFAMPGQAYYNPLAWGGVDPAALALWTTSFILLEDKFRALFAMMFGAGVAIQLDRKGRHGLRAHYARMTVLFAIGFIHATLLFSGDVLRLYALAGLVLPLCLRLSVRGLWIGTGLLVSVHLLAGGWIAWGWLEYWWLVESVPGTDPAPLAPAQAAFGADPAALSRAFEIGRESFGGRVARRLDAPLTALLVAASLLPLTLASMLAGMALWRGGLLCANWTPARALRLGWRLAMPAGAALAAMAAFGHSAQFHGVVIGTNALVWSAPFDLMLGIALAAAAIAWFQQAGKADTMVHRLAAAGRLALTNYLATSLILAWIFHGWGLALFGALGRPATYAVALLPMVGMLLWSPLWLSRFRIGPAEWLWRAVSAFIVGHARGRRR